MIIEIPEQILRDFPAYGFMAFGILTIIGALYCATIRDYFVATMFLFLTILLLFISFLMLGYIEVRLT